MRFIADMGNECLEVRTYRCQAEAGFTSRSRSAILRPSRRRAAIGALIAKFKARGAKAVQARAAWALVERRTDRVMDRTCNRCGMPNLVASRYSDEAIACLSCGYTEYAAPKPIRLGKPNEPPPNAASVNGRLGAQARWGNRALTDRQIARILEWRADGHTIAQIAAVMGRSTSTIQRTLSNAMAVGNGGNTPRHRHKPLMPYEAARKGARNGAAKRLGKPVLTDEQRDEMRALYAGGGFTQTQIAERYGVSNSFACVELAGVTPAFKPKPTSPVKRAALDPALIAAIQAEYDAGDTTQAALARKHGLSKWRIGLIVRRLERYERRQR